VEGYIILRLLSTIWLQDKLHILEEFSSALEWIAVNKLGVSDLVHTLDDFLIFFKIKGGDYKKIFQLFYTCVKTCVPLSVAKTELPSHIMDLVGIKLDIQKQETRLPIDKFEKCSTLLNKFLNMNRCTLIDITVSLRSINFPLKLFKNLNHILISSFVTSLINIYMFLG
jgi:hypothetical protein